MGNYHVRFLEGRASAMGSGYSITCNEDRDLCSSLRGATDGGFSGHPDRFRFHHDKLIVFRQYILRTIQNRLVTPRIVVLEERLEL